MRLSKGFLWTVLASFSIAAFLGVQSLLFNLRDGKWIGTMFSIVLFSLTSLGASIVLERRIWKPVMIAVIALGPLGLCLFLFGVWSEHYDEILAKSMGITSDWTIALPVAGLLAMTRFTGFLSAVRNIAILLVFASASVICIAIISEPNGDIWGRLIGSLLIFTCLGIIAVPILYKVRGIEKKAQIETSSAEMKVVCPRCLLDQILPTGPSRCARCRLKFMLDIEEPRCPSCNYLLYRLTTPRCPECGFNAGAG